jgi:hypothetical protein
MDMASVGSVVGSGLAFPEKQAYDRPSNSGTCLGTRQAVPNKEGLTVCNSTQKRWLSLMGVFLFVCLPSLLSAKGQQSSPPPAVTIRTAIIAALASVCVALISLLTAVITARITSRKTVEKANPISLDELLKPEKIQAIKDAGHFVSEEEVLKKLMLEALTDEFQRFKALVLDTSGVAQMIEKSRAQKIEFTEHLFRQVRKLTPPGNLK